MQSHDENNHFMSPTKRFGVSLNVDTGYRKPPDSSMLDTPITRRPNGSRRSSTRETFLDDITPVDLGKDSTRQAERDSRDSHDLSLSPRNFTRDSLVDNMLLSLDQLSFSGSPITQEEAHLYSTFAEGGADSDFSPRGTRASRHNQSYSSDYDTADDGSHYSAQYPRGRRSNSAGNFPTGMGRGLHSANGVGRLSQPSSRSQRKDSKGSSANSIDMGYTQVNGTHRWAGGHHRRSSSFDHGNDRSAFDARPHITDQMPSSYEYEAAPTPNVPVGPRRTRPVSPSAEFSSSASRGLERKKSNKSSRNAARSRPDTTANTSAQKYGLHDNGRELPPLPAFNSPQLATKPKDTTSQSHHTSSSAPAKPGFFRRVFGSSKNIAAAAEPAPPVSSTAHVEPMERTGSKQQNTAPPSRPETPPSRQAMRPNNQPAVLQKKPSSFFRRRKKSFSEQAPMPQPPMLEAPVPTSSLPPPISTEAFNLGVLPSPVSSLRQVMNPYLDGPAKNSMFTHKRQQSSSNMDETVVRNLQGEEAKGFSPGYRPNKDATIRPVRSASPSRTRPSTAEMDRSQSESRLDRESTNDAGATFFQDGNEADYSSSPELRRKDTAQSKKAASDVTRDIAMVAEYEMTHSKKSSSAANATRVADHDEVVVLAPSKDTRSPAEINRVRIEPTESADSLAPARDVSSPQEASVEGAFADRRPSEVSLSQSATVLPALQIGDTETKSVRDDDLMSATEAMKILDEEPPRDVIVVGEPTEGDRQRAQKVYDGNEDFIQQSKAAAWLGGEGAAKSRTLIAYMDLYDFSNLNILAGLRKLCGRLSLRAESQQVDRILDVFAQRWCASNPNHGFKVVDVVHTICYSILLLNTDLHMADIEQKMTRSQFVKNTMPTIRQAVLDAAPDAFEPTRPSILPGTRASVAGMTALTQTDTVTSEDQSGRISAELERPSWRTSFKPPSRAEGQAPTALNYETPNDDCGPLVKSPFIGTLRTWEVQVEIVLKDFYNSIRSERLPLFGATDEKPNREITQSTLSIFTNGMLRRTPSVISKTPSETHSYVRARTADGQRLGTGKWNTKNRSRPRVYPSSTMGSSRTSLDDQSSMWSPSGNSSKYSLGKTHTSMSVDSFGSNWQQGDYQQSIGFANALSQAIIREETVGSTGSNTSDDLRVAPLLEDESLGLAGAPWAKEGIVKHKHHLEAVEKKAKHRDWVETFVVIEKGYMSLFSFSTKTSRHKSKGKVAGGVVGGGNWQDNAEQLGQFLLRQTIASALPSPGYSKARPHVFALSLPTGAVHLFQVGTPDIVKEFVSTANYWSARLSNHPLVGGISNIEYGWSDAIVNNALVSVTSNENSRTSTGGGRPSLHGSMRGSYDHGSSMRARLAGDKVLISDWTPPTQSMRASSLMEQDQLNTLLAYVKSIEDELQKHNQLRNGMTFAYSPRHPNAQKAMNNWEKKSSYLLREIVKFRTYIDSLQAADAQKQKIYAERAVAEGSADEEEGDVTLRP